MIRRVVVVAATIAGMWVAAAPAHAASWCGTPTSENRTPELFGGANVHVVYAIPSDGNDRLGLLANAIETDAEEVDGWWRGQDPTRTIRFDFFPFSCGPQVDIATVRLSAPSAQFTSPSTDIDLIAADLQRVGMLSTYVSSLVYFDGPVTDANQCGIGGQFTNGPGIGVVFVDACARVSTAWTAAHELTHGFGAVPEGAPHRCPDSGHTCDSVDDLMYPFATEGRPLSAALLDPGRDDYYGHSGGWLDVQDSHWLRHLDQQVHLAVSLTGAGAVSSDVPGVDCTASCGSDWDRGAFVALTPEPAARMRFIRWTGACTGEDLCQLDLDADKAVTAAFGPATFRLAVAVAGRGTVKSRPSGISCRPRCKAAFISYEPVRLSAKPAKGWRLKTWGGACRGNRPVCTVPMKAATNARAVFVRKR